jgi:DNA invertase Pin-like site-specific DNA recombinase
LSQWRYAEEGDTVVMWPVDRLGRSLIDVLNTVNLLGERGVHVRFISDGIDPIRRLCPIS